MTKTYQTKQELLYGDNKPLKVPDDVIANRVSIMNCELSYELNKSYKDRDYIRVNKLIKGIRFWETINEM